MSKIEIRTAHFEGSHTSHDWQPYDVEILSKSAAYMVVKSSRLIEGRKRRTDDTYRIHVSQVRNNETQTT